MSEPNSLYVKIKIKKENLQQFFQQKPSAPVIDDNWRTWWTSREMYSKQELQHLPVYRTQTNRQIIDEFLGYRDMGTFEGYDAHSECWTFISVFFSENYGEILPMLALLKDLATYQDEGDVGIALIYDHQWGDEMIMAYMEFINQKGLLKSYTKTKEVDENVLYLANQEISQAVEKFNKQLGERE
ncbi:hypothetical protein [Sphingobacterium wenxiniae]|uniref:Uncharacterized protein n=1 Tax=Sphingobacterium wenxiniae TaxID=683125 RepID=A0A1I6S396_9SPHI|nr:hypothetical protein [Sphingobacterium wenxiniae]SFS71409.1 hypothetical protein SAMN05660206_10489 [Sphingobacterium wenxiniae]